MFSPEMMDGAEPVLIRVHLCPAVVYFFPGMTSEHDQSGRQRARSRRRSFIAIAAL